jgi:nucleosome binding factor SPN SPT16 subunit
MAFVFKDLNKPVHRITAIPMENLEMIKSWLDECDILFSEGLYNLNWVSIIQKIKKDPEGFIETGGWGFLHDAVI